MKKIWFKNKTYGWGWTPITWQGWAIIAAYLIIVLTYAWLLEYTKASDFEVTVNFLPRVFILTVILLIICYRTGEKPRWHWGKNKN